jgi:hypothetical protein
LSDLTGTVLAGVLVFLVGQVVVRFVLDPLANQRAIIGEIADRLIFHAAAYMNPGVARQELLEEASRELRRSSAQLQARTHVIPLYDELAKVGIVRSRGQIDEASRELIGLSNSVFKERYEEANMGRREKIERALSLRSLEPPTSTAPANSDNLADR